ncbi:restriction endonuclease [Escherichia coli]|nr:restriction endonuclease [Escherichia coli]
MLPSETMIWQPEFTDKTLSRKPGAVHNALIPARRKRPAHCVNRHGAKIPE